MNNIPSIESGPELGRWIWKNLVPPSGQAQTVQGELLRASEKLRDEAHRNGNLNWDNGFEILVNFLEKTLCDRKGLSRGSSELLRVDLNRLQDYNYPYIENDLFERIESHIYEFCRANRTLIAHVKNENLHR